METQQIHYKKDKLSKDSVSIFPKTPHDHTKLSETLTDKCEEYYTFTLYEEKTLRVVICGIPAGVTKRRPTRPYNKFPGVIVH